MKMNKLITTATVLALIGLASVNNASAALFNQGDLMLNFRLNDVGNTGTSLEYDLGPASSFNFAQSNATIANVSAGLTAVYGSGWASSSDLVYSIVGATTGILYISNPNNGIGFNATQIGSPAHVNDITGIYGSPSATLESDGSYAVADSQNNSYNNVLTHENSTPYTQDYSFIPGNIGASEQAIGSTSDVYSDTTSHTLTDLGTFEVNSSGQLILNPVAVPEPASYALGGIAAALFVIMHRRSKIRA